MIFELFSTSLLLISNPAVTATLKCSVAPQSEEGAQTPEGTGPVLQTPLKIFASQSRLSLVDDKNLEKNNPALTNLVISNSFPKTQVSIPDMENTSHLVFIQLGGKDAFGRSARFFGDLLLTEVYCPDYKDTATSSNCNIQFPSIQIFDTKHPAPANSRIRVKIFRRGNLLIKNLTPELMGADESKTSYYSKYTRNESDQPLTNADESNGSLKGYFLYSSYQFEGASNPSPQKGDGTYEVKYGLEQASYRIPVLSRQKPNDAFEDKKAPDSYLVEVEVTPSDKPAYTEWAIVKVGVGAAIRPSDIEFKTK